MVIYVDSTATNLQLLDDSISETLFGADVHYYLAVRGSLGDVGLRPASFYSGPVYSSYSYKPGLVKRVLTGFKIPPSTDRYDISGLFAINKLLILSKM